MASLHRASHHWERAYDLDECVRRWNRDLALTADRVGSPGHHVVVYEDLANDPEAVLRPLVMQPTRGVSIRKALEEFAAAEGLPL